jgi:hypothetical protein
MRRPLGLVAFKPPPPTYNREAGAIVSKSTEENLAMLSRAILCLSAAALLALAAPEMAMAQFAGGLYRGRNDNPVGPTVSPYLNLLQNNNQLNPVTNYQSLVRPLIDNQSNLQRQGASIQQLQNQIDTGGAGRGTGHASFFMNFSHFFPAPSRQQQARR